jgi:protein ImuB
MFACLHASGVFHHELLVELAYCFSPKIEETANDTVVLDIAGCELLFGTPGEIAESIARQASDRGLAVNDQPPGKLGAANIAVASNPNAAIYAARFLDGVTVIPRGQELEYLGSLPLTSMIGGVARASRTGEACTAKEINEAREILDIIETLELWGVRSFRDFADLPEAGVAERLGPLGVRLQTLARGETTRPLLLSKPAPGFEKSIQLDDPIELLEPLSFIIASLLNQLCANLNAQALATNELRLVMELEDRSEFERKLSLPFPMRDSRTFLKLLLLDIESHPPKSAVIGVSIAAEPAPPRSIQKGLFQPLAPEPEKLELTLARLSKLVGAENVGSLELVDTHRPGAFRLKRFGLNRRSRGAAKRRRTRNQNQNQNPQFAIRNPKCLMGFRVFRPPLRAKVESKSGRPARINARTSDRVISGKILQVSGPWRTTGDWWTVDGWARDEWDVEVVGASSKEDVLYRIYRDLWSETWFIEGVYD